MKRLWLSLLFVMLVPGFTLEAAFESALYPLTLVPTPENVPICTLPQYTTQTTCTSGGAQWSDGSIDIADPTGQNVHPSVTDVYVEHGIAAWRGYRYWMAVTPYPFTNGHKENPSVMASHDGITWVVPSGIQNPLYWQVDYYDPNITHQAGNDPCIVYDPATSEMRVYFFWTSNGNQYPPLGNYNKVGLVRIPATGNPSFYGFVLTETWAAGGSAPSVWHDPTDNLWHMMHVKNNASSNVSENGAKEWTSSNGLTWSGSFTNIPVDLSFLASALGNNVTSWHGQIKRMSDGSLWFLVNTNQKDLVCDDQFTWYTGGGEVFLRLTNRTTGFVQHPSFPGWLMPPRPLTFDCEDNWTDYENAAWDSGGLYHGTFVADGDNVKIWYSARVDTETAREWHVGYTRTPSPPEYIADGGTIKKTDGSDGGEIKRKVDFWVN